MTLESVLNGNPFNKSVVASWRKQLEAFRQGQVQFADLKFSIEADQAAIVGTKQEARTKWQVLPQPFIGNPEAKIWILNINPGFCMMDYFDNLTIDKSDYCGKMVEEANKKDKEALNIIRNEMPNDDNERTRLEMRQKSALNQLTFCEKSFFFLKDCFKHDRLINRQKIFCGYEWWRRMLFGNGKKHKFIGNMNRREGQHYAAWSSENIFNLESFPYHSTSFYSDASFNRQWPESTYYKFWKSLINWAVQDESRIFIVRSPDQFEVLLHGGGDHDAGIRFPHGYLVLRNRQKAWFSDTNIETRGVLLSEIINGEASQDSISFYREWFAKFKDCSGIVG